MDTETGVVARARHVPISARKVRRVIDKVRGLDAGEALEVLRFMPQPSPLP